MFVPNSQNDEPISRQFGLKSLMSETFSFDWVCTKTAATIKSFRQLRSVFVAVRAVIYSKSYVLLEAFIFLMLLEGRVASKTMSIVGDYFLLGASS